MAQIKLENVSFSLNNSSQLPLTRHGVQQEVDARVRGKKVVAYVVNPGPEKTKFTASVKDALQAAPSIKKKAASA